MLHFVFSKTTRPIKSSLPQPPIFQTPNYPQHSPPVTSFFFLLSPPTSTLLSAFHTHTFHTRILPNTNIFILLFLSPRFSPTLFFFQTMPSTLCSTLPRHHPTPYSHPHQSPTTYLSYSNTNTFSSPQLISPSPPPPQIPRADVLSTCIPTE